MLRAFSLVLMLASSPTTAGASGAIFEAFLEHYVPQAGGAVASDEVGAGFYAVTTVSADGREDTLLDRGLKRQGPTVVGHAAHAVEPTGSTSHNMRARLIRRPVFLAQLQELFRAS